MHGECFSSLSILPWHFCIEPSWAHDPRWQFNSSHVAKSYYVKSQSFCIVKFSIPLWLEQRRSRDKWTLVLFYLFSCSFYNLHENEVKYIFEIAKIGTFICNLITKYLESLLAICQKTLQGLVHVKVQRTFWVKYSLTLKTFMNDFVTVDLVSFLHSIGAEKLMTVRPLTLVWRWGISDVRLVLHFVRSRTVFEVFWQFLLSTWAWCPRKGFFTQLTDFVCSGFWVMWLQVIGEATRVLEGAWGHAKSTRWNLRFEPLSFFWWRWRFSVNETSIG